MWRNIQLDCFEKISPVVSPAVHRVSGVSKRPSEVIFTASGNPYPVNRAPALLWVHSHNSHLRVDPVPALGNRVKNKPEIPTLSGPQRSR